MHYPNFCRLLNCWLEPNVRDMQLQPAHTTITINSAYAGKLHRDANNLGPSFVKAFGCCTGGALGYYQKDPGRRMDLKMVDSACGPPEILDLHSNLILMDGTKAHYVQPFEGERFSVVWFTCSRYVQGNEYLDKALQEAGFPIDSKFHERSKKLQSMVVDQPAMKVST